MNDSCSRLAEPSSHSLTEERWAHIIEEHAELKGLQDEVLAAVREPERVLLGNAGELLGANILAPGKALVAVYRETAIPESAEN